MQGKITEKHIQGKQNWFENRDSTVLQLERVILYLIMMFKT